MKEYWVDAGTMGHGGRGTPCESGAGEAGQFRRTRATYRQAKEGARMSRKTMPFACGMAMAVFGVALSLGGCGGFHLGPGDDPWAGEWAGTFDGDYSGTWTATVSGFGWIEFTASVTGGGAQSETGPVLSMVSGSSGRWTAYTSGTLGSEAAAITWSGTATKNGGAHVSGTWATTSGPTASGTFTGTRTAN
jgi:hypothetical protein